MFKIEAYAVPKTERLRLFRSILFQSFTYYNLVSNKGYLAKKLQQN